MVDEGSCQPLIDSCYLHQMHLDWLEISQLAFGLNSHFQVLNVAQCQSSYRRVALCNFGLYQPVDPHLLKIAVQALS